MHPRHLRRGGGVELTQLIIALLTILALAFTGIVEA